MSTMATIDDVNVKIASAIAKGGKVTVIDGSKANKETRAGCYIYVSIGLSMVIYFVGRDLQSGNEIVEVLG